MASEEMRRLRNRAALLKIDQDYYKDAYMAAWSLSRRLYRMVSEDVIDWQEVLKRIDDFDTADDALFRQWQLARKEEKQRQKVSLKRLRQQIAK